MAICEEGVRPRVEIVISVCLIVARGCGPRVVIVTSMCLIVVKGGVGQSYKHVANCGSGAWAQSCDCYKRAANCG